jgi:hypothetical protein
VTTGYEASAMFKMRREQREAFREDALRAFEDRVIQHVERCLPDRRVTLGEEGLREVIRLGVRCAEGYGIEAERDVCKLVDLMLVLGVGFDREHAWAREILGTKEYPWAKVRRLCERAVEEA